MSRALPSERNWADNARGVRATCLAMNLALHLSTKVGADPARRKPTWQVMDERYAEKCAQFADSSKSVLDAAAALHATTSLCERGYARTCVAKPRPILDPILGSRNVTKTGFAESGLRSTADCIATHSDIIHTLLVLAYSSFCVVCLRCCMKRVSMST